jgi:hypothetical protein
MAGSPWVTVIDFCKRFPEWKEHQVRHLIFRSVPRETLMPDRKVRTVAANGLAPALRKVGNQIRISVPRFEEWLLSREVGSDDHE